MPSNSSREDSSDQSSLLTGDVRAKHMASGQAHSNLWGHTGHPRVRVTHSAGKPLQTQLLLLPAADGRDRGKSWGCQSQLLCSPVFPHTLNGSGFKVSCPRHSVLSHQFPIGMLDFSAPGLPWFSCSKHSKHSGRGPGRLLSHPWLLLWPMRPGCLFIVPGLQSPPHTLS